MDKSNEHEVRDLLDAAAAALKSGDWPRYAEVWAHEPYVEVIHPGEHEWLTGWDAVGSAYVRIAGCRCPAKPRETHPSAPRFTLRGHGLGDGRVGGASTGSRAFSGDVLADVRVRAAQGRLAARACTCLRAGRNRGPPWRMIRKLPSAKYRLYSRKKDARTGRRRHLGTFRTRAAALKHEREIQFFKRR